MNYFVVNCGRLLCGDLREILESEKFSGRRIEWIEGRGVISRLFTVKGEEPDLSMIAERVRSWLAHEESV